jgi:bidirectional [NiFe] hydrogenase diaphorase subunit
MIIIIDGKACEAEYGEYILQVARRNDIYIPTLCHSDALPGEGSCRLCIVEVIDKGWNKVVTSCIYPITREVEVFTSSEKIKAMRRTIVMLLSARVPHNEAVRKLREQFGLTEISRFSGDNSEQCVLCGLCVKACEKVGASAIATINRGVTKKVSTPYDEPSSACIGCGACAYVCPTGAISITEGNGKRVIWGKEFELLKCEACGEHYASEEQVEYAAHRIGETIEQHICDKCKKKLNAEKFKSIYTSV